MATPGLPDPKINFYGAEPSDTQAYQDALATSITALEQRYANPNWFNVAAGFFKPQLGGFGASLGSASQALGENVEKQRESQLPIAQMRAQLAASKIAMGQGSAAAKALAEWKATGQPMSEAIYAHIVGLDPNSAAAAAAKAAYEGERTGQTLKTSQQQLLAQQLKLEAEVLGQQRAAGVITVEQYKQGLALINDRMKAERPAVVPTGPLDTAKGPRQAGAAVAPAPAAVVDGNIAPPLTSKEAAALPPPPSGYPVTRFNPLTGKNEVVPNKFQPVEPYLAEKRTRLADLTNGTNLTPADKAEMENIKEEINRLTSTPAAPAAAPPAAPPATAATAAPAAAPPAPASGKRFISSNLGSKSQFPEAVRMAEATRREEKANTRLDAMGAAGGTSETYEPASRILKDQIQLIQNNPAVAKKVMSLMAQGTFRSQIEAALEAGIGLNFSGLSGNIHIPVSVAKRAGLDDKERAVYDALASNFAAIAIMKQRAGGLSPNSARNAEIGLYNDLTPSMNTTPPAALKALGHLQIDLDATNAQYKFARSVYDGKHPDIGIEDDVPNRLDSVFGDQSFADVYGPFAAKHQQLLDAYQAHINKSATKKP